MQCAVIEYARNVAQLQQAGSVEFGDCTYPVISYRPGEPEVAGLGTSMRLGAYPCLISEDSLSMAAYQERIVSERHRHRYEVNRRYLDILVKAGMRVTGVSPDGQLVEIIELENHPWFVGTLFHPEFKSRPTNPHPLFVSFVQAMLESR
jgi:CTP synthase